MSVLRSVTVPKTEVIKVVARRRPGRAFWGGLAILGTLLLAAAWMSVAPLYDPLASVGENLEGPSLAHPLGTDNLGRDTFTRLALAARTSLVISGAAALLAAIIGTAFGLIAGYVGGATDSVIMRVVDVLLALPAILLALVIGVILGSGTEPLILALGLIYAPTFARVMRAPVMALRERDFILSARLSGTRPVRMVLTHVLPNTLTPLFVQFASVASQVVLVEAALSYLGLGVQPPEPSAGRMISEFLRFMGSQPLLIVLASLVIVILSVGWNLLADGTQEFLTPRRRAAVRPPKASSQLTDGIADSATDSKGIQP